MTPFTHTVAICPGFEMCPMSWYMRLAREKRGEEEERKKKRIGERDWRK